MIDPIASHSLESPRGIAVEFGDERWTWSDLEAAVKRAAGFLDAESPPGVAVLLQGWNHPNFIVLREAVYRTGRTFTTVSPTATEEEVRHVLGLTGAKLFLRSPEMAALAFAHVGWSEPLEHPERRTDNRRDRAQTLLLTSGTTGLPKACLRPVSADANRMTSLVQIFDLRPEQTHLTATPLYHSGPSIFQRAHLALGSTTHLLPKFDPQGVWAAVDAAKAATAFFVPTHYHRLLRADPGVSAEPIDTWWIAGAPASADLKERVIARIGEGKLWEFLGSSETGTVTVMPPARHRLYPGSVGRPPAGVSVRILDEQGRDLPPGEVGLIYVKSGMLMSGYLGDERADWHDGFLSVGDLGWLDEDGNLFLSDRRTDLIISGGVNVYPAEVEGALLSIAGVHEAAVVGEPDEEWGARVVAVVAGRDLDAADLARRLGAKLSPAKRPKRIEIWPELPHNAIGKPLRAEVRRRLADLERPGKPAA